MEMDFSAATSAAKEMANSSLTPEAPPAAPVPAASPVASPQTTATENANPSTPTPAGSAPVTPGQAPTDPTFQVDLGNGKIATLTQAELKEAYLNGLRQADYTRKTQEAAATARAYEQQYQQAMLQLQQREQLIQQALNNPQALQQQQQQSVPFDPNQPVTFGQLQPVLQQIQQQVQAEIGQTRQAAAQYVQDQLAIVDHSEKINQHLNGLYKEMPLLTARKEFEDILRFNVARMEPQTEAEALNYFQQAAQELNKDLMAQVDAINQTKNSQRAALVAQANEPPGGAAPSLPKPSFKTADGKLDWAALQRAGVDMANSAL